MQTLDQIKIEGYSKWQLYRRVALLEREGLITVRRGPTNAILLDEGQERVLQLLCSLEQSYKRPAIAVAVLKGKLAEAKIAQLQEELAQRDREIERLHALVKRHPCPWWRRVFRSFSSLVSRTFRSTS